VEEFIGIDATKKNKKKEFPVFLVLHTILFDKNGTVLPKMEHLAAMDNFK
jgi:hypothetical protein